MTSYNDGFDDEHVGGVSYEPWTPDASDADTTGTLSDDPDAAVPGREEHEPGEPEGRWREDLPGQEATDKSAAGVEQGGLPLDTERDDTMPGEVGLNSSGDSMGDDSSIPGVERVREQERRLNEE